MYILKQMPEFDHWLNHLRDRPTRIRLLRRLEKAQHGLVGACPTIQNRLQIQQFGPYLSSFLPHSYGY